MRFQISFKTPVRPKLKTPKSSANKNRIVEGVEDKFLASYTVSVKLNGHQMPLLRDTSASIDFICRKYITPHMFTGEIIWVQQPLDENPVCLPLADVIRNELDKGRYIMGNNKAVLL
ncbi:stress response protein nst1 [Trichonephila inaurata madagascariensis]|uniref:Stress response protein nst1 n=1 Tax=Trichonephila inaurata madagascariensis TaxID=2747483 RepID=A0A8X6K4U4_9ARAC|nr:stress response protein nst1 [Trichonephila inaurata madagascariensis]